jgi:hypothetical protein
MSMLHELGANVRCVCRKRYRTYKYLNSITKLRGACFAVKVQVLVVSL